MLVIIVHAIKPLKNQAYYLIESGHNPRGKNKGESKSHNYFLNPIHTLIMSDGIRSSKSMLFPAK
jgi:hypothetical protein